MTEINSEVLENQTKREEHIVNQTRKKEKNFFSKIISLMNENPNYKMLGALAMMLINFSICLSIANWLKNSNLVS